MAVIAYICPIANYCLGLRLHGDRALSFARVFMCYKQGQHIFVIHFLGTHIVTEEGRGTLQQDRCEARRKRIRLR